MTGVQHQPGRVVFSQTNNRLKYQQNNLYLPNKFVSRIRYKYFIKSRQILFMKGVIYAICKRLYHKRRSGCL